MSGPIVEQLANGVQVILADGRIVTCKALPLRAAMAISEQRDIWLDPQRELLHAQYEADPKNDQVAAEYAKALDVAGKARLAMVRLFVEAYPDLAAVISAGDIETLLPTFFWSATGASVRSPSPSRTTPSTGTPSSASTPPITAAPQT